MSAGVFKTRLGWCGVSWTERGVDHFVLPVKRREGAVAEIEAVSGREVSRSLPPLIRLFADRAGAHLRGRSDPLRDIDLDLQVTPFRLRVFDALRQVDPGETISYGELAARAGSPASARAVGGAMAANPVPLLVPCHRVLPADGSLGSFSSAGGPRLKAQLLYREGVILNSEHAAGMAGLKRVDRRLRRLINRIGPYMPACYSKRDPFETLAQSIIHQQLSMKAARTIEGRVCALTPGTALPSPEEIPALEDETLRGAGLSWAKVSYLRDLAARVADGRLQPRSLHRLSDEDVIETLTAVRGIGVWSAQMFLIFYLGRLDVLPTGDVGLLNAAGDVYGLDAAPTAAEMTRMGECWRPWRSMATWYLWASQDETFS